MFYSDVQNQWLQFLYELIISNRSDEEWQDEWSVKMIKERESLNILEKTVWVLHKYRILHPKSSQVHCEPIIKLLTYVFDR
jgi:hypothetical protein